MRLAISNIAWLPQERLQAYAAMAACGVTGLEVAPGLFFHASEDPFAPERHVARTALAEIAAEGLILVSMQSLLFGVADAALFDGPERQARFERGMTRAIDLAGTFGIPNLVFGSPVQRRVPEKLLIDEAWWHAAEVFRRLGDRATAADCKICIEPNPAAYGTNFLNTLDEAASFVSLVDHPAIHLILDLGAMQMNGEYGMATDRIADLAARLNHVHVSEPDLAPAPADPARLALVLGALRASRYRNAVSIEMRRPAGALDTVRRSLRRLRDAATLAEAS
jgi:sugar phosphate isomerase/epimerase